jgi:D-alanyl-D-alanine dipeptidase
MTLIEIAPPGYDVELSIAYATADNFTNQPIYARPGCYLHTEAVPCAREAIAQAGILGLRLRLYDAFRPSEAQWVLWNHTPDPNFISDPRSGSPHSRGAAVDLTLIDSDGNELDMGTPFDDFTPSSFHGSETVSVEAQRNRLLLLGLMTGSGWEFYSKEWWHYQLPDAKRLPILSDRDLPIPMMAL